MIICVLFFCVYNSLKAQDQSAATSTQDQPVPAAVPDQPLPESDSAIASKHALRFADSLVKANFYADWPTYLNLSMQSAMKYYGGKDAFKDHVVMIHYRNEPTADEKPESLRLVTLQNDTENWQCVIEKVRETFDVNHGKTKAYTYLVGESSDNGLSWKFLDISHNSLENVINLMPTIMGTLPIPESKTVSEADLAAQQAAAQQPVAKKKPAVKKSSK